MSAYARTFGALAGAVALAVLANRAAAQAAPPAKPAAVVNGEPISLAEVEAVVVMMRGGGPEAVPAPEAKRKEARFLAVGVLIDDALWRQALVKGCPPVGDADVSKKLNELVAGLQKSQKTLDQYLRETGQTLEGLRAKIVALVQWAEFVKARATEEEVFKYYHEYKPFFHGDLVRVSHIVLHVKPDAKPEERQAAHDKLTALRQQIADKKIDFAAAAKQYSDCPTAKDGGDIGLIPRKWGMVDEAFAKAAFDPKWKAGDVTDVVATEFGLHLILVAERKPGQPVEFEKVKAEVREMYVEDLRQALIAQQRKTAKVEVNLE